MLRLSILGVVASLVLLVLISAISGSSITESLALAGTSLLFAAFFSVLKLVLQAARFHIIQSTFSEKTRLPMHESFGVRIGSEFIAMAGVSYVGDEFFRTAYLMRRGVSAGTSLWLSYSEIFLDVIVGGSIGVAAGLYALSRGAVQIGTALILISAVILSVYTVLIYSSLTRNLVVPQWFTRILQYLIGRRMSAKVKDFLDKTTSSFSEASRLILRRKALTGLIFSLLLTAAIAASGAATLMLIADAFGHPLTFFDSLLAAYASITLATLPITLGGSGVSEAGLYYYLTTVLAIDNLPLVVAWRVASFHIPLLISALTFLSLLRRLLKLTPGRTQV
jgi:uncharacterized membrane protein YbhN (UPF0104 family)